MTDEIISCPVCKIDHKIGQHTSAPENTIFLQPKNTMPRINQIWAFVSVDAEDGNEGVIAATVGRMFMPLVAADEKRLEQLIDLAQRIASLNKMKIRLVKFTHREEVGFINPAEDKQ